MTSDQPDNPYQQGSWGPAPAPAWGYPAYPQPQRAGMAITALVLGIAAVVLCWTAVGGLVLGLLGVVFGVVGLRRARRGEAGGQGRAIAGLICGAVGFVLGGVFLFVWISFFSSSGFSDYFSCVRDAGQDQAKVQQCIDQFRERTVPSAPTS